MAEPELQVVACENPAWVVDAVERETPDLIVVDVTLGALLGVEVLSELQRSRLNRIVPVVVLGKDEGLEWRAELFRAGASEVIGEPLDGEPLRHRLRAALEERPWGGAALGELGPGPAVETIVELQRAGGTAIVELTDGKRRGAIRVEKGKIAAAAVAGFVGEEALNCLAGRRGWTATVRLASAAPSAAPAAELEQAPGDLFTPVPQAPAAARGEPHVLVADDEDAVRRLLEVALKRRGFRVTTAGSGAAALEAARAAAPDVVLSDVVMPGGDGWWFLARLRQDFLLRETPFILFTNKGVDSHALQALGVRPDAVISKDPHAPTVARILDDALAPGRALFVLAAARPDEPMQGALEGFGPLTLLRALRQAGRRGLLKLQAAEGASATLALRQELLASAEVRGPCSAAGRDAVALVVALEWRSYRFEPAEVAGADALGVAEEVLREACARCGRFFERVRVHGFAPAGGVHADPDGLHAYGMAATARVAPVVRALARGQTPAEAAAATGLDLEEVGAILAEMLRRGAILLSRLDDVPAPPAADAVPPARPVTGGAAAARPAAGAAGAGLPVRPAAGAAGAGLPARPAVGAAGAGLPARPAAGAALAGAEKRIAELERRATEAEKARDAAARALADARARGDALAAEQRRLGDLAKELEKARADSARLAADATRARAERDDAAVQAEDARLARDSVEASLHDLVGQQKALEAALKDARRAQATASAPAPPGAPKPDPKAASAGEVQSMEKELARVAADLAARGAELEARAAEQARREATLAAADVALIDGRTAVGVARAAVEARLRELAPREGALRAREIALQETEVRLQAEREVVEKMRAEAEAEAARLAQHARDDDRHSVDLILAELQRVSGLAERAVREAEAAKEATAAMVADTTAARARGRDLELEMERSQAEYAALDRIYNEPTLIRPMPQPPSSGLDGAGAEGKELLAHWGDEAAAPPAPEASATPPAPAAVAPDIPADLFAAPAERTAPAAPAARPVPSVAVPVLQPAARPVPSVAVPVLQPAAPAAAARGITARTKALASAGAVVVAGAVAAAVWVVATAGARPVSTTGVARGTAGAAATGSGAPDPATGLPDAPPPASARTETAVAEAGGEPDTAVHPRVKKRKAKKKKKKARVTSGPSEVEHTHALVDKGTMLLLNGKIGPAIATFKAAASADPTAPEPCRGLVFGYLARADKPAATSALACYVRLRPDAPDATDLRRRVDALK